MTTYESYHAVADAKRAALLAATESPFTIEVRFLGGLTDTQQAAFTAAADRWTTMIVGDLPPVVADGETIDDVLILAQGRTSTGRAGSSARPVRPCSVPPPPGPAALLPAKGVMSFDTADLEQMEATAPSATSSPMRWATCSASARSGRTRGLLQGAAAATRPSPGRGDGRIRGSARGRRTPRGSGGEHRRRRDPGSTLAGDGLPERADERVHRCTGQSDQRVTVASLGDLGLSGRPRCGRALQAARPAGVAESGEPVAHSAPIGRGAMLRTIPIVLPANALA